MKTAMLTAVAVSALAFAMPAMANQDDDEGGADGRSSVEVDLRYANNIDTSITTDITYNKDVALRGTVRLDGDIEVDSSAVAVTDAKQFLTGVTVNYREENELNAENGFVDPVFGPGVQRSWSEPERQSDRRRGATPDPGRVLCSDHQHGGHVQR